MKEIGGYIELGLKHSGREVIGSADIVFLKNGRSSFHVILKETKPSKVYLPYYLCAEMRTVLHHIGVEYELCLLYTSPSPRDRQKSRMPSSA